MILLVNWVVFRFKMLIFKDINKNGYQRRTSKPAASSLAFLGRPVPTNWHPRNLTKSLEFLDASCV